VSIIFQNIFNNILFYSQIHHFRQICNYYASFNIYIFFFANSSANNKEGECNEYAIILTSSLLYFANIFLIHFLIPKYLNIFLIKKILIKLIYYIILLISLTLYNIFFYNIIGYDPINEQLITIKSEFICYV
jgi:hypothetical protein